MVLSSAFNGLLGIVCFYFSDIAAVICSYSRLHAWLRRLLHRKQKRNDFLNFNLLLFDQSEIFYCLYSMCWNGLNIVITEIDCTICTLSVCLSEIGFGTDRRYELHCKKTPVPGRFTGKPLNSRYNNLWNYQFRDVFLSSLFAKTIS